MPEHGDVVVTQFVTLFDRDADSFLRLTPCELASRAVLWRVGVPPKGRVARSFRTPSTHSSPATVQPPGGAAPRLHPTQTLPAGKIGGSN